MNSTNWLKSTNGSFMVLFLFYQKWLTQLTAINTIKTSLMVNEGNQQDSAI